MINNTKILWIVVAVVAVISVVAFFNGRTVTQVVENPLGAVVNPYNVGSELGINGVNQVVVQGDFKNSTTTFVGFLNPVEATSTIDLVILKNTGVATSTYVIHCGTTKTAYGVAPTTDILTSGDVATSTNFFTMVNNEANAFPVSGGSTARLRIGPAEYFVCYATTYATIATHDNAFTNVNNTFDGHFWVRFLVGR